MNSKQEHNSPIFIHSLFRSGSTYVFNVFRRSDEYYWCYQEPTHEVAFFSKNNRDNLLLDKDEMQAVMRHADLDSNYFQELYETWNDWKELIKEQVVYDAYFDNNTTNEIGLSYWSALINAAKARPVLQECRTSGRIMAIKEALGGFHIYLWRNPWDQWWSYKVSPYFDVASQLIIHSSKSPFSVKKLCAELALPKYGGNDIAQAFVFYYNTPLTSEQSYLIFYILWCLGLRSGIEHSDLLLSIDHLSESGSYRKNISAELMEKAHINGVDFSDCRVPQSVYTKRDILFFESLEERVHCWLREGGWSEKELNAIQSLRMEYQPAVTQSVDDSLRVDAILEQLSRARDLARRFETEMANRVQQAKDEIKNADSKIQQAELKAAHSEAEAQQALSQLETIYTSTSWKITKPARALGRLLRRI